MSERRARGRKISLRWALYALIVAASLLPALVLAPWFADKARGWLLDREMIREEMFHREAEIRLSLETERLISVLENKSDPIGWAMDDRDGDDGFNLLHVVDLFDRIIDREPMISNLMLYNLKGEVLASRTRLPHAPLHLRLDSPALVIPMHGRRFLGAPRALADGHVEFTISVPVRAFGEVRGVLAAAVQVQAFWDGVQALMPPHDSRVYLVDSRGALLAALHAAKGLEGRDAHTLLTGQEIVRELVAGRAWKRRVAYRGIEGDEVYGLATLVPGLKWGIVSEIPEEAIMHPIARTMLMLATVVVLLHVFFGLLSLVVARRLLTPFYALMRAVRAISEGRYRVLPEHSGIAEMDELADAFTRMAQVIGDREERLRTLSRAIEQAAESIIITDRNGVIEYMNAAFSKQTGYSPEEALGRTPSLLKSGEQDDAFYEKLWRTIRRGEVWEGRLVNRRKDGSLYSVLMTIAPVISDGEITHFVAIQQDISKQEELEAQFRQAQKMEALGALVGGIAHDFNNSLAAMNAHLYLMRKDAQGKESLERRIGKVSTLVDSSANMIAQLLAFARKDAVRMAPVDLRALAEETAAMMRASLPASIGLETALGDAPAPVMADKTQLRQMMINLIVNARDALEGAEHPCMRISLEIFDADEAFLRLHEIEMRGDGRFVRLTIADNGCGMDEETRRRMFDPFFTTKPAGKGSGLGLAMVFGAMQRLGGAIEVESAPGEGARFHLCLPLLDGEALADGESAREPAAREEEAESRGDVLLVDDREDVREPIAEFLECVGFRVWQAEDGEQGLALFDEHCDAMRLVVTDMVMPGMSGAEMMRKIRERHGCVPAVFITGYDPERLDGIGDMALVRAIGKPVDFNELEQAVTELLDEADEGAAGGAA